MVKQAAGGGDENVDAAIQLLDLIVHRNAADQQRHVELVIDSVFFEGLRDLGCEFAGRREDQRTRHAGAGAAGFEPGDHRQGEGCGFAGAGLGDAEDITAAQCDGDGVRLDGGGDRVTSCLNGGQNLGAEPELSEG